MEHTRTARRGLVGCQSGQHCHPRERLNGHVRTLGASFFASFLASFLSGILRGAERREWS